MRQIAVINQKGGVGKTTTTCNVGAAIASTGRRVLLIDLDPQAHLTMHLGIEPDSDRPSIYDVLTDNRPAADTIVTVRDNLDLIPSHIDLAAAEMELVSVMGREVVLREALQAHQEQYDFMMIDCPPSLGVLTINGLAAMREVFIPMQAHFLALQGMGKLLESIRLINTRINPDLRVGGIIFCMYESATRLAGEVATDLASFLEGSRGTDMPWADARQFNTAIRRNVKLAECPSYGQTIFDYAPRSNGAIDYAALTAEILGLDELTVPVATQPAATEEPQPVVDQDEALSDEPQTVEDATVIAVEESVTLAVHAVTQDGPAPEPGAETPDEQPAAPTAHAIPLEHEPAEAEQVVASINVTAPAPAEEHENVEPPAPTKEQYPSVPHYDTGDRIAYGPDDVTATESPTEAAPQAEQPGDHGHEDPQPQPQPESQPASPPAPRRISIDFGDETTDLNSLHESHRG